MLSPTPFQRLEARIKHMIAQQHRARSAEAETAREAGMRRRLLSVAGFADGDVDRFAEAASPGALPVPLREEIHRHVGFCLATQRRMARRRDARYDLTRHIFLHRLEAWLEGRAAPIPDPVAAERLPGAVLNRRPRRRAATAV